MRRGTTPTITLEVINYTLSQATHVWVTFEQSGTEITKEWSLYPDESNPNLNKGIRISGQYIIVTLSQAETLEFAKGWVEVQAKMKQDDMDEDDDDYDNVVGTDIGRIEVKEILNEEIM